MRINISKLYYVMLEGISKELHQNTKTVYTYLATQGINKILFINPTMR